MKKPGLPLERHQEIGRELQAMRNRLQTLTVELGNAYPRNKISKSERRADKAIAALDSMRSALDDIACAMPGGGPRVYYPLPDGKQ